MRASLLRSAVAAATVAAGFTFAVPAHAENVEIFVTVTDHFGATATARSDKPGESFDPVTLRRIAVTDAAGLTDDSSTPPAAPTVGDIDGAVNGSATYVITAHPAGQTNESFNFTAVVECVRTAATGVVCAPSLGLHTVITVVTGPFDS